LANLSNIKKDDAEGFYFKVIGFDWVVVAQEVFQQRAFLKHI